MKMTVPWFGLMAFGWGVQYFLKVSDFMLINILTNRIVDIILIHTARLLETTKLARFSLVFHNLERTI